MLIQSVLVHRAISPGPKTPFERKTALKVVFDCHVIYGCAKAQSVVIFKWENCMWRKLDLRKDFKQK